MADHYSHQTGGHQHQNQNPGHGNPHGNPLHHHQGFQPDYRWPSNDVAFDYLRCWAELRYRNSAYNKRDSAPKHGDRGGSLEKSLTKMSRHPLEEHSPPATLKRAVQNFLSEEENGQALSHGLPELDRSAMSHLKFPPDILNLRHGVPDHEAHKEVMGGLDVTYTNRKEGHYD